MLTLWFRRFWAAVALATMIGGVVTPLFGDLHTGSDIACTDEVWGIAGHHDTTQIETVLPPVADGHCALCHLQRTLWGAADDAKRYVAVAVLASWTVTLVAPATIDAGRHDVPSRAPPVFA